MKYTHYDLGSLTQGAVVTVDLEGTEANVQLLDGANLANFRRNAPHRYFGGHYTRSPARLVVPSTGHWHVVVDLGGYPGTVRSAVTVSS